MWLCLQNRFFELCSNLTSHCSKRFCQSHSQMPAASHVPYMRAASTVQSPLHHSFLGPRLADAPVPVSEPWRGNTHETHRCAGLPMVRCNQECHRRCLQWRCPCKKVWPVCACEIACNYSCPYLHGLRLECFVCQRRPTRPVFRSNCML